MIEAISSLSSAFGLSASAGLNAYLPLLIVALTARFTPLIRLNHPFDALTNGWIILILVVLLAVEVVADKVPVVDSANDVIQTIVRPITGAILFAAATNTITELHPVLAMACGVILAGGVHAVKASARPLITASTGGVLNPLVSAGEDVVAALVSILALLLPILLAVILLLVAVLAFVLWRRQRRARGVPVAA